MESKRVGVESQMRRKLVERAVNRRSEILPLLARIGSRGAGRQPQIDLSERCANLCFGGRRRNRLFMCGSTAVYSLYVNTQGAPGG
jgi:hypothetical protein